VIPNGDSARPKKTRCSILIRRSVRKVLAWGLGLPERALGGGLMDQLLSQLEEFRKDFEARNERSMTREELAYLECANDLLRGKEKQSSQ
jgi:hypothetical protein